MEIGLRCRRCLDVRTWHQGNELSAPVDRRLTGVELTAPTERRISAVDRGCAKTQLSGVAAQLSIRHPVGLATMIREAARFDSDISEPDVALGFSHSLGPIADVPTRPLIARCERRFGSTVRHDFVTKIGRRYRLRPAVRRDVNRSGSDPVERDVLGRIQRVLKFEAVRVNR